MYKGLTPTILREMIGCGTYFTSYEVLTAYFTPQNEARPGILGLLLSGGLTGVITWTVMFPIDVVKSRIQMQTQRNDG